MNNFDEPTRHDNSRLADKFENVIGTTNYNYLKAWRYIGGATMM